MQIEVMVADESHAIYADEICEAVAKDRVG